MSAALGRHAGAPGLAVFFAGFMVSSPAWCFVSAGLVALLRKALPGPAVRALEAVSGVSLLAYAALSAYRIR